MWRRLDSSGRERGTQDAERVRGERAGGLLVDASQGHEKPLPMPNTGCGRWTSARRCRLPRPLVLVLAIALPVYPLHVRAAGEGADEVRRRRRRARRTRDLESQSEGEPLTAGRGAHQLGCTAAVRRGKVASCGRCPVVTRQSPWLAFGLRNDREDRQKGQRRLRRRGLLKKKAAGERPASLGTTDVYLPTLGTTDSRIRILQVPDPSRTRQGTRRPGAPAVHGGYLPTVIRTYLPRYPNRRVHAVLHESS